MGTFALKCHMRYKKHKDVVESKKKHLVAFLEERNP